MLKSIDREISIKVIRCHCILYEIAEIIMSYVGKEMCSAGRVDSCLGHLLQGRLLTLQCHPTIYIKENFHKIP